MRGNEGMKYWRMSTSLVLLATISLHQTRALPGILDPMPAVPVETPQLEIAMKTSQSEESLPQALPLASPERSSVDEEHFNMAASYLKSQFSIPHHLVPSYQDTANWWPDSAQDRIRRLPNLANHQLDSYPDASSADYEYIDTSNEFQLEEDRRYKRRPDLDYKWAQEKEPGGKVYKNEKPKPRKPTNSLTARKPLRSKKPPYHKSNQNKKKQRFPRHPAKFQNFVPKRETGAHHLPQNHNFLAAMTSQLRHSISSALTGTRRQTVYPLGVQAGYLRKHLQLSRRKAYPKTTSADYEDYYDNRTPNIRIPDNRTPNNRIPDNRVPDNRIPDNRIPNTMIPDNRIPDNRIPDNRIPNNRIPDNRIPDNRIPDNRIHNKWKPNNRIPDRKMQDNRTPGNRMQDKRISEDPLLRGRHRLSNLTTRPSQGVVSEKFPARMQQPRSQGKRRDLNKRKRRRKGQTHGVLKNSKSNSKKKGSTAEGFEHPENTHNEEVEEKHDNDKNDKSVHSGNYFDGLEMDFWEEEVETATKPDYRRRWKDLNNSYEDEENNDDVTDSEMLTEEAIGSRRFFEEENENSQEKQMTNSVSSTIGWGEKMWQEIEDDWNNDGEKEKKYKVRKRKKEKPDDENVSDVESIPILDDGARYLSAWADAGEILEPKFFNDNRPTVTQAEHQAFLPSVPYDEVQETNLEDDNQNKEGQRKKSYNQKKTAKFPSPAKPIKRRPIRTRRLQNQSFRNR